MLSLRETAQRCGLALSTAFFWRHKILDAIGKDLRSHVLEGIIQSDETYVPDNYKGNCLAARNLGKSSSEEHIPAYKGLRVSGHRHGRGNATHTRGLSKQKICVACAIDEQGKTLSMAAGKGMVQLPYLDYALCNHLAEKTVLVTDRSQASLRFCEAHELPLIQLKAGSESQQSKPYNLQRINNLHGRLKSLLRPFKAHVLECSE